MINTDQGWRKDTWWTSEPADYSRNFTSAYNAAKDRGQQDKQLAETKREFDTLHPDLNQPWDVSASIAKSTDEMMNGPAATPDPNRTAFGGPDFSWDKPQPDWRASSPLNFIEKLNKVSNFGEMRDILSANPKAVVTPGIDKAIGIAGKNLAQEDAAKAAATLAHQRTAEFQAAKRIDGEVIDDLNKLGSFNTEEVTKILQMPKVNGNFSAAAVAARNTLKSNYEKFVLNEKKIAANDSTIAAIDRGQQPTSTTVKNPDGSTTTFKSPVQATVTQQTLPNGDTLIFNQNGTMKLARGKAEPKDMTPKQLHDLGAAYAKNTNAVIAATGQKLIEQSARMATGASKTPAGAPSQNADPANPFGF